MRCTDHNWRNGLLALLACVLLLVSFPAIVRAQDAEFEKELEKTNQLIVMVTVPNIEGFGAGIIFGREKDRLLIATAYHVLHKGDEHPPVTVKLKSMPDKSLNATLLKYDAASDVAVLSVEKQGINVCALPFDRLGNPAQLERKDAVSAVGNPNGASWATPVEPDRISQIISKEIVFQSDFIREGHSGGALLDKNAALVGMILADQPPFGRAINIDALLQLVKQWGYPVQLQAGALELRRTLLHAAAIKGDVAAINNLLVLCGDANAKDEYGVTPLHLAALYGTTESMLLLLKAGTDPNVTDSNGDTPLHWAVTGNEVQSVKLLLRAGARIDAINNQKQTPLRQAVDKRPKWSQSTYAAEKPRWLEIINFLVGAGAKIEAAALYDPLYNERQVEGLKVLLKAVPDLNARIIRNESLDNPGGTLLHLAVGMVELEIVELLLKLGADVNAVTILDETPLLIASRRDNKAIQDLLIAHGGRMKR